MTERTWLVGAYGMFWDRDGVNWWPGSGPNAWQLLGRLNKNKPKVRVCDFRRSQGFYVLFDDFRANYVGLARGKQGIGARLRNHAANKPNWSRFCWFSLDAIAESRLSGWSEVQRRESLDTMSSELMLRECEALLITILGSGDQNEMRFLTGKRWEQLRDEDFIGGGIATKVDPKGYTDVWHRETLLEGLEHTRS